MSEQVTPRPLTNDEKEWLCEASDGEDWNGITLVKSIQVDSRRWHSHHWAVFRMDGAESLFGMRYELGLTESQEGNYPGLYEGNHDQFQPFKVKEVTETTTTYRKDK